MRDLEDWCGQEGLKKTGKGDIEGGGLREMRGWEGSHLKSNLRYVNSTGQMWGQDLNFILS